MNKSPAEWSRVRVISVMTNSAAGIANVLRMALKDIAEMIRQVADAFDRGFERGRQEKNDGL
jgi:hypothetical protein